MSAPTVTEEFEARRSLLFTVVYEMLGSAADGRTSSRRPGCSGSTSTTRRFATCGRSLYGVTDPRKLTRLDRETQLVT